MTISKICADLMNISPTKKTAIVPVWYTHSTPLRAWYFLRTNDASRRRRSGNTSSTNVGSVLFASDGAAGNGFAPPCLWESPRIFRNSVPGFRSLWFKVAAPCNASSVVFLFESESICQCEGNIDGFALESKWQEFVVTCTVDTCSRKLIILDKMRRIEGRNPVTVTIRDSL